MKQFSHKLHATILAFSCVLMNQGVAFEKQETKGYLGADYLYWKTLESQNDFAVDTPGTVPFFPTMATGNLRYPKFDATSGVRFFGGICFGPAFWEIQGDYTYFSPSGRRHVPVNPEGNVYATYGTSNLNDIIDSAATITMTYQAADLLLAKRWYFTPSLQGRLLFGPTGLFVKQDIDFVYQGSNLSNSFAGREDFRFTGGGLRAGFDFMWNFAYGFGFIGKTSIASIFGYYRHLMENLLVPVNAVTTTEIFATFNQQRIVTHMQFLLGPSWKRQWKHIGGLVFVGWELNHIWNLQQTYRGVTTTPTSNVYSSFYTEGLLGFQGLTASFSLTF